MSAAWVQGDQRNKGCNPPPSIPRRKNAESKLAKAVALEQKRTQQRVRELGGPCGPAVCRTARGKLVQNCSLGGKAAWEGSQRRARGRGGAAGSARERGRLRGLERWKGLLEGRR